MTTTEEHNPVSVTQKIDLMLRRLDEVSKELAEVRLWALALASQKKRTNHE